MTPGESLVERPRNTYTFLDFQPVVLTKSISMSPIILKFSFILLNQQDLPGGTKELKFFSYIAIIHTSQTSFIRDKLLFQFVFHNSTPL